MENDYELLYLAGEDIDMVMEILYKKYAKILYTKALKYSSSSVPIEECLNEAKLSMYEAVENYQDKYSFITYLNACLERNLANYKKSRNRNRHKVLNHAISLENDKVDLGLQLEDNRYKPEKILIEELEYTELKEKIINKLTWKEELIFNLKEQNYTNKEISEITDNNLRTVYNIIRRIQNKVTKIMSS